MRSVKAWNVEGCSRGPSCVEPDAEVALSRKEQEQKYRNVDETQSRRIIASFIQMMQNRNEQVKHITSFEDVMKKRFVQVAYPPDQQE